MKLQVDIEELRPLLKQIVGEAIAELERHNAALGDDRDAYSEAEAADRLGIKHHVLRDARRRGEIEHTRIVGDRVRYTRQHLLEYLSKGRKA